MMRQLDEAFSEKSRRGFGTLSVLRHTTPQKREGARTFGTNAHAVTVRLYTPL